MSTTKKIENAIGLYLEGIRDGNMREALDKYTGDRYTQHSTGVADGKEGFIAFFTPFLERNPVREIRVLRTIEDGQYVFCHVYQRLNDGAAQWVTADLFDTDDQDRMIEHWDVIQEYADAPDGGASMIEGPMEVEDVERTAENKALVRRFVNEVLVGRKHGARAEYVSPERYVEHGHPPVDEDTDYVKVHRLIGQGSFVVTYSQTRRGGADHATFDIFRLKDGKIVEHWDIDEKISPKEMWNNSGKF